MPASLQRLLAPPAREAEPEPLSETKRPSQTILPHNPNYPYLVDDGRPE